MRNLCKFVNNFEVGYSISNKDIHVDNKLRLSSHEIEYCTLNSIRYFCECLAKSLLEGTNDLTEFRQSTLHTRYSLDYKRDSESTSKEEFTIDIDMNEIFKLAMFDNLDVSAKDRKVHLWMCLVACFENIFKTVSENFDVNSGKYIHPNK